jgi:hypothetical protein
MELKGINVTRRSSWFGLSTLGRPVKIVRGEQGATRAFGDAIDQLHMQRAKEELAQLRS